jgi:hypothetical protein
MTSPFERLPAEVFDIVAAYLDLPEYRTIRLTSQRLYLLGLPVFEKRFFTKLVTTLGSPSLDRLVHVANHAYLSKVVTILEIRLLTHRDYKILTSIARIGRSTPPKRFIKVSCVRNQDIAQESTLYDDVLANRQAKCITERLARGLSGLENLKAVRFRTHQPEPHGWKTIAVPEGDEVFRSRCLRAVFDALVKGGIKLETFIMGKEQGASFRKCADVPYPALQLPVEYLQRLKLSLEGLEAMSLSIVSQHNGHHRLPGWENGLGRFISSASNLKHLTLSLDRKSQLSQYGARIVRSLSDSLHLEHLETFALHNTTFHESDVAKFIKTHAGTLQGMNFTNVCLLTGNWLVLLAAMKVAQNLQALRLAYIEGAGSPVQFRQRNKERRKVTLNASEDGLAMADLLDEFIGSFSVDNAAVLYALNNMS